MIELKANKQTFNQAFVWCTFVLAIFPILTFGLRSVFTIIWAFLGIGCYIINKEKNKYSKKYILFLIVAVAPFLYLCLSLIYTENLNAGFNRLTKMLPLIVFPIIFYLNKSTFDHKKIKKVLWFFSISVILLVVYQILYSLSNLEYLLADLSNEEIVRNNLSKYTALEKEVINTIKVRRFRNFIIKLTDTHFTYQGLWIAFVIFILLNKAAQLSKTNNKKSYILIFIALTLLLWMFFISTRMPLMATILAYIGTLFIFNKMGLKKQLKICALVLVALVSSYIIFAPLQVRVNEIFKSKFELPTKGNDIESYNSINVRNGIYVCAFATIKENILFGVGVGDSQDSLNKCYKDKIGAKIYTWEDYNTHNQYLFFFLASGIIGLLLFLILIYINFNQALAIKHKEYLYFIIIICLISLTENILSRSDGVMFFSLFSGLFLFNIKKLE
ncbi:O-antigen ligase family protein [Hwangdonia lutea]|uniref:O-antigen ligase family protein n=1 Tax=Hwangdonia lutea TaxID=3075823 RepID=A0AA97ERA0_9FLAO|nr:O-antigen ligase family protein [Hwangdonia sp. SCSIO 19198]WOD45050.1 O-antigen ligase family protein [Hwangdonia sp. SCSIO 19198]